MAFSVVSGLFGVTLLDITPETINSCFFLNNSYISVRSISSTSHSCLLFIPCPGSM